MEPERWRKVEQVYYSALDVAETERLSFIEKACGADEALKREVQSLLAQGAGTDTLLGMPAVKLAAKVVAAGTAGTVSALPIPCRIGRYRVVRVLGEGGMGAVYEAEQEQPRRVVALKVIKPGFATLETLRRFQHEAEALGRLQHPGIAQIYEASTADTGFGPQPYFAMELIRGRPLHEYAEVHVLETRERLALMAKVCDAVEHAHQRGVIHRDLKPGNILVDETGQPKVLDFGVARVTESDIQHTRQTDVGQLVGTLAYMSPEQVAGDPGGLDNRSDVYALGVMLYALLADKLPYDINRKPLHEAVAIIRDREPARLSSIRRSYRGDIDTMVAKALEKDKARRYGSAADLAGDIRRYLAHEPITARPASATYQLQKFARRHRGLVAGTTAVFLVLVAGIVASTWEALRARTAQRAAAAEAATSQAINEFLQKDLLAQASASKQSGPGTRPDHDLKVRTALDRAAARVAGKFDRQPEVEAAIRDTIGETYMDLGLYPEARTQVERALNLQRRVLGAEDPKTLKSMRLLGAVAGSQGKFAEAEALFSQALRVQRRVLGPDHPDTLASMSALADAQGSQGKFAPAELLLRQSLDARRRVLGPEHPDTLASMKGLANIYALQGKFAEAEALYSQTLEIRRRVLGPEHPETLASMSSLAQIYTRQGKYAEAEALDAQAVEIERRVLGPEHPGTLRSMNLLANVYLGEGKHVQAEGVYRQVLEIQRRVLGAEHIETLVTMNNVAESLNRQGKYAPAGALFLQTLEISRRVLGPESTVTLALVSNVASVDQRLGKYGLAETYAVQALELQRHALGPEHPDTLMSEADLALAYVSEGKFAQGERVAREAVELDRKIQPDDWQRFRAEALLGASLSGEKKYAEAEPLLVGGYKGMLARKPQIEPVDRDNVEMARQWMVRLYEGWGKPEKAAEWRQLRASR